MEDATSENLNNKLEHLAQTQGLDISEVSKLVWLDCSRLPLLFDPARTGHCNRIGSGCSVIRLLVEVDPRDSRTEHAKQIGSPRF